MTDKRRKKRKSKSETAKALAISHFAIEPNLKHVHVLKPVNEKDPNDPIKLLEVVEGTIERGIEPIAFPANPERGIDYPVVIVEVSPREYERVRHKKLTFKPHPWTMGEELSAN